MSLAINMSEDEGQEKSQVMTPDEFRAYLASDTSERFCNPAHDLLKEAYAIGSIPYNRQTREQKCLVSYKLRNRAVTEFSWAIPTQEAIETIVKYGPILEVGAGLGYWASLVNRAGGDIIAYDVHVGAKNKWFDQVNSYYPINTGGSGPAVKQHPEHTLLMVWPCYDKPMDIVALRQHKGKYLIYVGEGPGGCTGSKAGHNWIEKHYDQVEEILIPQWSGIHDYMTVYARKGEC